MRRSFIGIADKLGVQGQISDQLDHTSCVETVMTALSLLPEWRLCVDAISGDDVIGDAAIFMYRAAKVPMLRP